MHWGRRKKSQDSSNSSPTLSSSLSHVFPISWLSKFKHMSTKSKSQSSKTKLKHKPVSSHSPLFSPLIFRDAQFYDGDVEGDDVSAYWQLSFGRETSNTTSHVSNNTNGGRGSVKSFWDDSDDDDDDELEIPKRDIGKPNYKVSDIRKRRDLDGKDRKFKNPKAISTEGTPEMERIVTIRTPEKEFYQSFAPSDSMKSNYFSSSNRDTIEGRRRGRRICKHPDHDLAEKHEVESDEEATIEVKKTKEHERHRKSLYLGRELQKRRSKQSGKVRAYSPRTPSKTETCKIRALEDMKKSNKAKKKKKIMNGDEKLPPLESFAVVKSSFDPEKDFKDSMKEMITENGIKRPVELENLLASYLSLNSDQYHDLIIKVFQQVWLEMSQLCSSPELPKHENSCCSDC